MAEDMNINAVILRIKRMYEEAIVSGGRDRVHSLIRSKKLIDCIHEFIKQELVKQGVDASKIIPPLGETKPELKMAGFLKRKSQDISVLSQIPKTEIIDEGVLIGEKDKISKEVMDNSISINIRSQLSSLGKNFDTLFERTFAEALNLHLRAKKLIMGEVYTVPLIAYDPDKMNKKKIGWREWLPVNYLPAFQALNNRKDDEDDDYKYERVCLLIIDFRQNPPKIVDSMQDFIDEGVVDKELAKKFSMEGLDIKNFVSDILAAYKKRHGNLDSLKAVRIS
jgi:hypothetical protein